MTTKILIDKGWVTDDLTLRYYSWSQEEHLSVSLADVPYCVAVRPHPTVKNHETYQIEFEILPSHILCVTSDAEFSPGSWLYPTICAELNEYLNRAVKNHPTIQDKLIKQELELCLV